MAEKIFKDGKLVVIKTGRTINDLKKGNLNDPIAQEEAKQAAKIPQPLPQKQSNYSSMGRNNEPLTDDVKAAIEKLRKDGTTESLISLVQYFSHPKWAARKLASDVMVSIGEKAVPLISQTLFLSQNAIDEDSLYWSVRTLGTIGPGATAALITILNSPVLPKSLKIFVVRALESCRTKEAILALINLFTDESWVIRREAGNALTKMGELAVPHLKSAFAGGSEDVRYWSVKILGGILGSGAIEYFKKMLKSEKRDMRYFATAALGEIDAEEAHEALVDAFSDDSWLVRAQVSEILEKKGRAAIPVLKKVLESGSSDAKFLAIKLMSKIMGKEAVAFISRILTKADADLKFFALSALAETMDENVIPTLIGALSDNVWLVRKHAAGLIEKFGAAAVPGVMELLKNSRDENLRYWAIVTLCGLGRPAIGEIRNLLAGADKKEKMTVLQNLKNDTAVEILPALFDCFADRQWPVRNEAYKKLSEISAYLVPAIFDYQDHPNADVKYWTGQLIKNNQIDLSKKLLSNLMDGSAASGAPPTAASGAIKSESVGLLLKMTQPDVVSDMIEFALANNDEALMKKLGTREFYDSLLAIYTDQKFGMRPQKTRDFVFATLRFGLEDNIHSIRNYLMTPECEREKIVRILTGLKGAIAEDALAVIIGDSAPREKLVSIRHLIEAGEANENTFDIIYDAFKGLDDKGKLNFIGVLPAVRDEKFVKFLANQFKVAEDPEATWAARLMVEWGSDCIEYIKGLCDSTPDFKVRRWLEKVISHIKGIEFI